MKSGRSGPLASLLSLAAFGIFAPSALAQTLEPAQLPEQVVWVSRNRGNDDAPGTQAAPCRTITRGLSNARKRNVTVVRVEYGEYGEGETLPIELPANVELIGIAAGGTRLTVQGGTALCLMANTTPARISLRGIEIAGAQVGLDATVRSMADDPNPPDSAPVELLLNGVTFDGCQTGLLMGGEVAPLTVVAAGLRCRDSEVGVDAPGLGTMRFRGSDCWFERCGIGLRLRAVENGDPIAYQGPEPHHDLQLRRCHFTGCRTAGMQRSGAAGGNEGPAYTIAECSFVDNGIGIDMQRPAADTALDVQRTRFYGNREVGLRLSGQRGDPAQRSTIADCDFRWNGVGLHATNTHVTFLVQRSRFFDQVGNALFLANFLTAPLHVQVADSLIAGNGGAGVYTMADGQQLAVSIDQCTIVDNGAAGVWRKTRHAGQSTLVLRNCIVDGNSPDLQQVNADEVEHCLIGAGSPVGDGTADSARGNRSGAPGFVDRQQRDYRLTPDSQCRGAGKPTESGSPTDLGAFAFDG